MVRAFRVLAVILSIVLPVLPAVAQVDPVKEKNARAIALSKGGDLDGAIALWQELLKETPADYQHRWVFHKNIGRNHQKLGRNIEAWANFRTGRDIKGSDDDKMAKWLGQVEEELAKEHHKVTVRADTSGARVRIKNTSLKGWHNTPFEWWFEPGEYEAEVDTPMRKSFRAAFVVSRAEASVMLKSPKIGRLLVETNEPEAEIVVDGTVAASGHLERGFVVGRHMVEVRLAGFESWRGELEVLAGRITSKTVTLKAIPGAGGLVEPPPVEPEPGVPALRVWGWVLLGSAAVIAGGGGGIYALATGNVDEQTDLHNLWVNERFGLDGAVPANKQGEVDADWTRRMDEHVKPLEYASYALWGTAGAAAITGAVLLIVDASEVSAETPKEGAVLMPFFAEDAVGVGFSLPF